MQNIGTKALALVAILTGCGSDPSAIAPNSNVMPPTIDDQGTVTLPTGDPVCTQPESSWCNETAWMKPGGGGCMIKAAFAPNQYLVVSKPILIGSITHLSCEVLEQGGKDDWAYAPLDTNPTLTAIYDAKIAMAFARLPELMSNSVRVWFRYAEDLFRHHYLDFSNGVSAYGGSVDGVDLNPLAPNLNYLMCIRFETI